MASLFVVCNLKSSLENMFIRNAYENMDCMHNLFLFNL